MRDVSNMRRKIGLFSSSLLVLAVFMFLGCKLIFTCKEGHRCGTDFVDVKDCSSCKRGEDELDGCCRTFLRPILDCDYSENEHSQCESYSEVRVITFGNENLELGGSGSINSYCDDKCNDYQD